MRADVDFAAVNRAALGRLPELLARWLPDGRLQGREYVARNPTRVDRRAGSFRVNIVTGRWADFATGDRGGDVVSLAAYLAERPQAEAGRRLAEMLRCDVNTRYEQARACTLLTVCLGLLTATYGSLTTRQVVILELT